MSVQTQMYFFNQRQQVVLLESGASIATRRYEIMYAKELTISKGCDNLIEFALINQDQKPVNVDGKEITARIISYNGKETLIQKTLMPIYPITGLMSLQLTYADLASIDAQKAYYTLEVPVGNYNYPAFVDAQGASRGVINIVNGVLPSFTPAQDVTIPDHPFPQANSNITYSSSTINTRDQSVFTLQTYYSNFTGSTQLQGSILGDFSLPYNITNAVSYTDYTGTIGLNITGYHPYVQMAIINQGTVGVVPPNIANVVSSNTYVGGDVLSILYR